MATEYRGIHLNGRARRVEGLVGVAFTPGHLVELYNASGTAKYRKHSTAGEKCERIVALETPYAGATSTSVEARTIDTAYTAGERAQLGVMEPGAVAYVYIKSGENIAIGDKLVSNGDGTLREKDAEGSAADLEHTLAIAEEALDLSASGSSNTRLAVRFV